MLRTKIPIRRKVPVLRGQKVVLMDAGELNPGLAEFLNPKPQAMDKAVEFKEHEVAGANPPSNTTLSKAVDMEQKTSTSTNPNGQYISHHQVSQLQELAEEPISPSTSPLEEKPVEREGRGQFITEQQLEQIKQISEEQERVSRILESLAKKITNFAADIRGKDPSLGKWPQSRREITGVIVAVILAVFIAVAVCFFTYWYAVKPVEETVSTWWDYFTSICLRFLRCYYKFSIFKWF